MFNEEEALPALAERLRPALDGLDVTYEVVAVDDGSQDETPQQLVAMRRTWPQLRVIRLRRNAGHQAALTAGLHRAVGTYVVSIDADLQDPPEKIGEMLQLARDNNLDIVYGVRNDRTTDTFFKRTTAGIYYRIMARLVGSWLPRHAGDFRLLRRPVVDALKALPERQPVYRLLVPSLGFASGEVAYTREERVAGKTKYPLGKMIRLALDSITNFSAAPLRLATYLGMFAFFVCVVLLLFCLAVFLAGATVPGWASIFVAVLLLGAIQLICLGLLGEYVGRIYATVQHRPTYFVGYDSAAPQQEDRRAALDVGSTSR
jgi:dolichol-phosphate mannosyltransferase